MKGLPLTYNRDMQEDKEPLFDSIDTIVSALRILPGLISGMSVKKQAMAVAVSRGCMWATDMADYLVRKGVPFRTAHEVTGKVVSLCIDNRKGIEDIGIQQLKKFSDKFEKDLYEIITPEMGINIRKAIGGTARETTLKRIKEIEGSPA
jgi:argininosuccinate lyase